tara:strand:- start:132 stop:557 length:426 start_codon:yes stop_codon:yes gene_type:complete
MYTISIRSNYGFKKDIRETIEWFVDYHQLNRFKIDFDVVVRGMLREGCFGGCTVMDAQHRPRHFLIELHSGLDRYEFISTLMHELVHVKQWVLKHKAQRYAKQLWHGKVIDRSTPYQDEPWEIEAYMTEGELTKQFIQFRN